MTYPSPEAFAARGPYQSTINYQYLKQYGSLPGAELALELLQRYWEGVPGDSGGSDLPNDDEGIEDLYKDQHPRHLIAHQKQSRGVTMDALDSALQFRQACLALVPFLGPSPAEVYGGPLRRRAPTPLPSPGHSQQQVDQTTADASASHSPISTPPITNPPVPQAASSPKLVAKPVKSCNGKDQWLPGEIERVAYLREVKHLNWTQIRKSIGRHTELSITDKYYAVKRKAKALKRMEPGG